MGDGIITKCDLLDRWEAQRGAVVKRSPPFSQHTPASHPPLPTMCLRSCWQPLHPPLLPAQARPAQHLQVLAAPGQQAARWPHPGWPPACRQPGTPQLPLGLQPLAAPAEAAHGEPWLLWPACLLNKPPQLWISQKLNRLFRGEISVQRQGATEITVDHSGLQKSVSLQERSALETVQSGSEGV